MFYRDRLLVSSEDDFVPQPQSSTYPSNQIMCQSITNSISIESPSSSDPSQLSIMMCQFSANPVPILQSNANQGPIFQSIDNLSIHCNLPILNQFSNPIPILDQSTNQMSILIQSANPLPIHYQRRPTNS